MSFQSYVYRWVSHVGCDACVFVAAAVLVDRLWARLPVAPSNVHRVWATAVLLAAKMYDDFLCTNARYAEVAGIPLAELNALETRMLALLDYRLFISADDFERFSQPLRVITAAEHAVGLRRACAAVAHELRARSCGYASMPASPQMWLKAAPCTITHATAARLSSSNSSSGKKAPTTPTTPRTTTMYCYNMPGHDVVRSASARLAYDDEDKLFYAGTPAADPATAQQSSNSKQSHGAWHRITQPFRRLFGSSSGSRGSK